MILIPSGSKLVEPYGKFQSRSADTLSVAKTDRRRTAFVDFQNILVALGQILGKRIQHCAVIVFHLGNLDWNLAEENYAL